MEGARIGDESRFAEVRAVDADRCVKRLPVGVGEVADPQWEPDNVYTELWWTARLGRLGRGRHVPRALYTMQTLQFGHTKGYANPELAGAPRTFVEMPLERYDADLRSLSIGRIRQKLPYLSGDWWAAAALGITAAVVFLHVQARVVHGDMHPGNMLVRGQAFALCDFANTFPAPFPRYPGVWSCTTVCRFLVELQDVVRSFEEVCTDVRTMAALRTAFRTTEDRFRWPARGHPTLFFQEKLADLLRPDPTPDAGPVDTQARESAGDGHVHVRRRVLCPPGAEVGLP